MKSWCDLSVFWELQEEIYSSSSTNLLYTSSTILTVSFLTEISCHLWPQWVAHQPEPEPAPHPNPKNPNPPTLFSFTPHTGSAHCLILSSKALLHPPHHIQSALTRRCSLAAHQFRGQASDTHLATIMHDSKAKDQRPFFVQPVWILSMLNSKREPQKQNTGWTYMLHDLMGKWSVGQAIWKWTVISKSIHT